MYLIVFVARLFSAFFEWAIVFALLRLLLHLTVFVLTYTLASSFSQLVSVAGDWVKSHKFVTVVKTVADCQPGSAAGSVDQLEAALAPSKSYLKKAAVGSLARLAR